MCRVFVSLDKVDDVCSADLSWQMSSEQENDLCFCFNQYLFWNITLERQICITMSRYVAQIRAN